MKTALLLCCLLAAAAAATLREDADASPAASTVSEHVSEILSQALEERPKKSRHEEQEPSADAADNAAAGLGQQEGWSPMSLSLKSSEDSAPEARSLTTAASDASATAEDGSSEDSAPAASGEAPAPADGEADPSYLSPLYAPAPGGHGGYGGYGGYGGPYIYILPIVLPPPAGHHVPPAGRHVVTETGHESHHYSGGYQPIYAGTHGVPPIYIPKGYGTPQVIHPPVHHGAHQGGHRGGHHGGHTTVHHEDKTIIRDINPPFHA